MSKKRLRADSRTSTESCDRRALGIKKSMRANRSKNTGPEVELRRLLRSRGITGYRVHWRVAGRPDVALPGLKVAIFVHGCFWHRCPHCNPHQPQSNREYWEPKFARTVERDRSHEEQLQADGWIVETVWECELERDSGAVLDRILEIIASARFGSDRSSGRGGK